MGIKVWVSEQQYERLVGFAYVDDKKPLAASPKEMQKWYGASGGYCAFHGAVVVPAKCGVHAVKQICVGGVAGRSTLRVESSAASRGRTKGHE